MPNVLPPLRARGLVGGVGGNGGSAVHPVYPVQCRTPKKHQTPFQRQLHTIQMEHPDLVLFVRVGSFYELYGDDADIGVQIGLRLMGVGNAGSGVGDGSLDTHKRVHRAGCRAQSFLFWAGKVVGLGRSVGRVEEVSEGRGGKNRALVQVYTPGTFGLYCEGFGGVEDASMSSVSSTAFMALHEDGRTSGLLGACCVDMTTGVLSLGVWQEVDVELSVLGGVVEGWAVQEVVVAGDGSGRGRRGSGLSVDTARAVGRLWRGMDGGRESRCGVRYVRGCGCMEGDDMMALATSMVGDGSVYFGNDAYRQVGVAAVAVALRFMRDTRVLVGMLGRMRVVGMTDQVGVHGGVGSPPGTMAAMASMSSMATPSMVSPRSKLDFSGFGVEDYAMGMYMALNGTSLRNLEIFGGASLHGFLSGYTSTMMGRRAMRRWLCKPLMDVDQIEQRLDVVDMLRSGSDTSACVLGDSLLRLHDIEKKMPVVAQQLSTMNLEDANGSLMTLAVGAALGGAVPIPDCPDDDGTNLPRERFVTWGQMKNFACVIHDVLFFAKEYIAWFSSVTPAAENDFLHRIHEKAVAALDVCLPIAGSIPRPSSASSISTSSSPSSNSSPLPADADTLILPPGVWPSVDQRHALVEACEAELDLHGQRLVGMVVETCRTNASRVPGTSMKISAAMIRKVVVTGLDEAVGISCPKCIEAVMAQAFPRWAPSERSRSTVIYREVRLTELGVELAAAQRAYNLEVNTAMNVLFNLYLDEYGTLLEFCQSIGELDALLAFSKLADDAGSLGEPKCGGTLGIATPMSRPRFDRVADASLAPRLFLRDAWNPQLLTHTKPSDIVPNTICVGGAAMAFLISGANSGGKTSILKTAAINAIMAQIGCYVPCADSRITPVNRILTRLGARDRLSAGDSTFAIEMKETSAILGQADAHSLAIIDELGRGTSPREGLAIAWATLYALASRCRTMLATHFHELNEDFELDPRVARFHMPISREKYRYKLLAGPEPTMSSGGITCASLAGIPDTVLRRAERISDMIKGQLRRVRSSANYRLAKACIEMLLSEGGGGERVHGGVFQPPRPLLSLQSLQRQVAFLIEDDDDI